MFNQVTDIVFPGYNVIDQASDGTILQKEEAKENRDFNEAVMQECDKFLCNILNFELVKASDVQHLLDIKVNTDHQLEMLGKQTENYDGPLKDMVK